VGARIRMYEPNQVYEASIRTVDRAFLFAPNHHKSQPLIADSSPTSALDSRNNLIPEPSVVNIFGAAVGRALRRYPIAIHGFEGNINHLHICFSASESQLDNIVPFFRSTLSLIARGVNRLLDREGPLFSSRTRTHPCIGDKQAENKLLYALTNAAKDNLVEHTSDSPFFTTYHHQAKGESLCFWYIDYDAYWTAGGRSKKTHRLKDYLRWTKWHCTPLPNHQSMTEPQRQTWFRQQVKALEEQFAKERRETGKTVIGVKRLRETDPRDRPKSPKESGKEPLCHAEDKESEREFEEKWKQFRDAFIAASADYRSGVRDREFPLGSFKPPLLDIARASGS